jgi:hypothetical protein
MAKSLTGLAVSDGKAEFYFGTLFALVLTRLGFRLLMEAVSGPRVAIRSAPWGRAGHTAGQKPGRFALRGERFVPFGEAFREALSSERSASLLDMF